MSALFALAALAGRAWADAPAAAPISAPADTGHGDLDVEDILDEIDDEFARGPLEAGATFTEDSLAASSGLFDAAAVHDLQMRHRRPSPWGRIDLAIAWRHIEREDEPRRDELVVVATWRH